MTEPILSNTTTQLARPRGIWILSTLMLAAAALHPVILGALGWPSMEVLWTAAFVPAVTVPFFYGRQGALIALLTALLLFAVVERLAHGGSASDPEHLVFAATFFIALVTLSLGIGGLAELLRREHAGRLVAERTAATSELAVALKHEIYNPLAALVAEVDLLREATLPREEKEAIATVAGLAHRIKLLIDRAAEIEEPRRVEYLDGIWMTDLSTE